MARYIKDFQINTDFQSVYSAINQYLQREGYEYINYDGENVFKKGKGVMSGPSFFKFSYSGNMVRMETWMKYALLPGVYVGELGVTGFAAAAVKGPWKNRIRQIEAILTTSSGMQPSDTAEKVFCTNCGAQVPATAAFCPVCGQKRSGIQKESGAQANFSQGSSQSTVNFEAASAFSSSTGTPWPPAGQPVSRKEFVERYAQPSLKTSITSIAILCYVCAGLTFLVSCLTNPFGIIDALLLAGLALGMHLAKSKVCAILILVLSIVEVIASLMVGAFPILWLIAGIAAVVTFSKIDKQYKQFLNR